MSEATSATAVNVSEVESNRDAGGSTGAQFLFSGLSTSSGPNVLPLRPMHPSKSALKGHQRSASHGGVATRPFTAGAISGQNSTGLASRPSVLKNASGHQRAFSQGQIVDGPNSGGLSRRGHSRVGSKTDFILPPGHKESGGGTSAPSSAANLFKPGHKRQASRSESIYTLRQGKKPSLLTRCCNFILRRQGEYDSSDNKQRVIIPNHLMPNTLTKKDNPNSLWASNYVCTTKYTFLSFIPKNLFEQFHRVANLYFIFIVLLNWFPAINAFGKEISMIPVLFVLGVSAIKDLFEDRRRYMSDNRINNSTCRIYDGQYGRYKKVLWKYVRVGDIIHLSNNELIPADILLLRSSEPHGLCYIDTCNLDGETNLKPRTVVRGFMDKETIFNPKHFDSLIEVDPPSTKMYKFHGSLLHPTGERVPLTTDNLLLRECMVKNTDFVEGIVVYAGHETKALLNNGGPRYKRSGIERQMNRDIIWCVLILLVLCIVGAFGCRIWLFSYEPPVPFIPLAQEPNYEGFLTFFTFVIILQVMIPLSLYVSVEMTKLLQVYYIHNDLAFYDAETKKRIECRALNTTEELGQVQYIFSDKTGTLTENKMVFRRCTANGVDYNHAFPSNELRSKTRPGAPMPVIVNAKLQDDLSYIKKANCLKGSNEVAFTPLSDIRKKDVVSQDQDVSGKIKHAQVLQELLLILALCNTVVVSKHPHHDHMNSSGIIETGLDYNKDSPKRVLNVIETKPAIREPISLQNSSPQRLLKKKMSAPMLPSQKVTLSSRSKSDLGLRNFSINHSKSLESNKNHENYSRLCESRSVTPSPPPPPPPPQVPLLNIQKANGSIAVPPRSLSPIPDRAIAGDPEKEAIKTDRLKLLTLPGLSFIGKRSKANFVNVDSKTPSPNDGKPIFEAESPDELALVEAAHTYDCRLIKRTPVSAFVSVPGEGVVEYEILKVLPFDTVRKMMSVIVRHPQTRDITLYAKGADSSIFKNLGFTSNFEVQQNKFKTQQQINSYARQGLRVLVMAKRNLTETEFTDWLKTHKEVELSQNNREKLLNSYRAMETNLTLVGATGTEDRLQDGVPDCIARLISAGIIVWVLTGDHPETAVNIAYSAKLFSSQMEIIKLSARSKSSAESDINFYLSDIKGNNTEGVSLSNDVREKESATRLPQPIGSKKKRALVVDGKTLTFILDPKSKLQKPFLELTSFCSSVLCCRSTPLQKAYIVKMVKEILHKKTLAIGDGANDVSMIQTADVGVGISGQEGMQAIMASDYALCKFKFLEKFLLVHGHWCYDRIARMVLYFFYKNATFVFLIFWFQLYCGYSAQVMIDQMYLMLYNLLFTSLPPLAIGVYEQDAPEEVLMANPFLYSQGRLGLVYQPHSFWISMADSLYQSIVIFFITFGACYDSAIGLWEFGTIITTACLFIMLAYVVIETKSWTIIHVISVFASIFLYFSFSLLYNGLCDDCMGLPSNYWVMQMMIVNPVFWLVILLSMVLALLPRFLYNCYSRWLSPEDVVRAVRDRQTHIARGEEFLASWSRSTSTSSIYRTIDSSLKVEPNNTLTSVG